MVYKFEEDAIKLTKEEYIQLLVMSKLLQFIDDLVQDKVVTIEAPDGRIMARFHLKDTGKTWHILCLIEDKVMPVNSWKELIHVAYNALKPYLYGKTNVNTLDEFIYEYVAEGLVDKYIEEVIEYVA